MERNVKRSIIIGIYAFLTVMFLSMITWIVMPDPTCHDGKLNQKEEKIDCGGPCAACYEEIIGKDLVVQKAFIVPAGEGVFDTVIEIHNPNALFGGQKVFYTIALKDASGAEILTRSDQTFILPNENKYIIEVEWRTPQAPAKAEVTIDKVEWVKFTDFDSPQIVVRNQRFGLVKNAPGYAEAFGLVSNESPFDFHNVVINVVLFDDRGVPIAVNKTVQNTLDSDTQREFRLVWPQSFPGTLKSAEMQAEANVFDSLNFMKKYFSVSE